ncbi:MAG: hydroxymethylbilane synthase [Nitrososphaerota archaeon]|nr:hydroxymethylbilane synthase [Nitrososphaerota archaeon]
MARRLLVGTRGSRLALAQTQLVLGLLNRPEAGYTFQVVPIKTAGDSPSGTSGAVDGKAAFTGEIEAQLADGKIDFAVHSMKDLPPSADGRLVIAATPKRGDARDAFVSRSGSRLGELRLGARIGTSSARRRAQIRSARRDVEVVELHGNVETRLKKLESEKLDGVVLAAAGLERLGLGPRITELFEPDVMVPAPCQGILAVQARKGTGGLLELLASIDDPATRAASECERAFSEALGGDCDVPLGAYALARNGMMTAVGVVAAPDGSELARASASGGVDEPKAIGRRLAAVAVREGAGEILRRVKG